MCDKYLRYIDLNLQNYLWKVGWDMLGTSSIYPTLSTTCYSYYDMVIGFNPLTLLDLTPLPIDSSGSLCEKHDIFFSPSQTYERAKSRRVLFDPCDVDWVYKRRKQIRTQRRSKLYPRGDGPFHVIAMIGNKG